VEHLSSLRAIPNLLTMRPADANETVEAWRAALKRRDGPSALILTRQNVETLDRKVFAPAEGLQRGAYILADMGDAEPELILMASGSEVGLIVEAGVKLSAEGINVRLISFPSWELFSRQQPAYRQAVLPARIKARLAVEAGVSLGWERWVGDGGAVIAVDRFGASAPYKVIYEKFGLTVDAIMLKGRELLAAARAR
jgi:transketolase